MFKPTKHHLTHVPVPGFTVGREELLRDIHAKLSKFQVLALLHGTGGIGKTTAALMYAHNSNYGKNYPHIIYLVVSGDLSRDFVNSVELVESLGLAGMLQQLPPEQYYEAGFEAVCAAIRALPGETLLILDNFNERQALVQALPWLERLDCRVLITSRAEVDDLARLPVDELPMEQAVQVFRHYAGHEGRAYAPTEQAELEGFLQDILRHTLLVEMMAKIARKARYDAPTLRRYVREGFVRHQNLQHAIGTGQHGKARARPEASVNDYMRYLFADLLELSSPEQDFLCGMALLPPQAQGKDMLYRLFPQRAAQPADFDIFLADLQARGVALYHEQGYALHPLVREVVLQDLKPDVGRCLEVVEAVTDLLHIDQTKDNPVDKFPYIVYGEALVAVLGGAERAEISLLLNELAGVYWFMGLHQKAAAIYEKALAIDLKIFGEEHSNIAACRSNLANVYGDLGQHERARDLLEAALASDLKNFGEDHPNVAAHRSNLANVYRNLGQHERARDLLEAALASDLKNFGENHPNVAAHCSNLAIVYRNLGQYERARDLLEAALASGLKNFGEEHPNVATRRSNLATVYGDLGQHERARDLLGAALASDLKNFGEDHPNVAAYRSNLANVYRNLGQYERARDSLEAALASDLKNFGEDHPNVATRYNNLAHVYQATGDYAQAEACFQQALGILLKVFGEGHPHVAKVRRSLGILRGLMGEGG